MCISAPAIDLVDGEDAPPATEEALSIQPIDLPFIQGPCEDVCPGVFDFAVLIPHMYAQHVRSELPTCGRVIRVIILWSTLMHASERHGQQ